MLLVVLISNTLSTSKPSCCLKSQMAPPIETSARSLVKVFQRAKPPWASRPVASDHSEATIGGSSFVGARCSWKHEQLRPPIILFRPKYFEHQEARLPRGSHP